MNERFIKYPEVETLVGVCKREIQRWISAGAFPQPVIIGRNRLFSLTEILAFIEDQKRKRQS